MIVFTFAMPLTTTRAPRVPEHFRQKHRIEFCKLHDLKQIEFLDTTGYASVHCCLRYLRARARAASGVSVNFDSIFSQPE